PAILDGQRAGIEGDDLAFVFKIDEDLSLAVGDGELRATLQGNGPYDLRAGRVNGGGVVAAAIKGEHAISRRVENDGVGAGADRHALHFLERVEVEDGDRIIASIAGKPAPQFWDKGDPMNAGGIGDLAHDNVLIYIQDGDAIETGDIETMRWAVNGEVIPAAFPTHSDLLDLVVVGGFRRRERDAAGKEQADPCQQTNSMSHC